MDLNGILLCACGAAYDIDPNNSGQYTADALYVPLVGYTAAPTPVSGPSQPGGPLINACLIGATATAIIVAFRGTLPYDTSDGIKDWLQDFFMEPVHHQALPGNVHSGFYDALMSIYPQVQATVQTLLAEKPLPVYVTGHSKGGGMAPLAAYLLDRAGIKITQVVTFAAPRTGDATFRSAYESIFKTHLRYENYGDLVPLVPPTDVFVTLLANALWYVNEDLYDLVHQAEQWNYVSLGSEAFIESSADSYKINNDEIRVEQVSDFIYNLGVHYSDAATALKDAHTLACGFGYMSGVCPAVICPGQAPP